MEIWERGGKRGGKFRTEDAEGAERDGVYEGEGRCVIRECGYFPVASPSPRFTGPGQRTPRVALPGPQKARNTPALLSCVVGCSAGDVRLKAARRVCRACLWINLLVLFYQAERKTNRELLNVYFWLMGLGLAGFLRVLGVDRFWFKDGRRERGEGRGERRKAGARGRVVFGWWNDGNQCRKGGWIGGGRWLHVPCLVIAKRLMSGKGGHTPGLKPVCSGSDWRPKAEALGYLEAKATTARSRCRWGRKVGDGKGNRRFFGCAARKCASLFAQDDSFGGGMGR